MNRPVHFEIHATDPATLSKFYADVFGWQITHMPQFDYYLINTGDNDGPGINGGFVKRMGAVCSLGVKSVDEAVAKATAAGAQIALPKMAIPGVGYQAYIRDPDENIVGLHQADQNAK